MSESHSNARTLFEKACTKCGQTKPFDEFRFTKDGRSGRQRLFSWCNACCYRDNAERAARKLAALPVTGTRVCSQCKQEKPTHRFGRDPRCKECNNKRATAKRRADPERYHALVKAWREANHDRHVEYQRDYASRRYRENKDRLDAIRADRGCERCGENDPVCLEFHHVDPSQKIASVGVLCGWSWKKLEAEIAKCVVLCANCHCRAHASRDPVRSRSGGARAKVPRHEGDFSWIY